MELELDVLRKMNSTEGAAVRPCGSTPASVSLPGLLSLWNEIEFRSEAKEIFIKEWKSANSCSGAVPATKGAEARWEMIKHVTLIVHFISNLMPPLIWQHEPVSLEVGNSCSRRPGSSEGCGWDCCVGFRPGGGGGVLVCEAQARCSPPRRRCLAQRLLTGPSPS